MVWCIVIYEVIEEFLTKLKIILGKYVRIVWIKKIRYILIVHQTDG